MVSPTPHPRLDKDRQFYMQVTAALLRRVGGTTIVTQAEFEAEVQSIMHRDTDGGVELVVVENADG